MAADVIANLYGGLGNQLFQLAAALHARRAIGGSTYDLLLLEGHRDSLEIGEFVDVAMRRPTRLDRAQWIEFAQERSPLNIVFRPSARFHERLTRRVLVKQSTPFDGVPPLPHFSAPARNRKALRATRKANLLGRAACTHSTAASGMPASTR